MTHGAPSLLLALVALAAAATAAAGARSTGVADRTWIGRNPPYMRTLARAWDVPLSAIRVTPAPGGRFQAWEMPAPDTGPRF